MNRWIKTVRVLETIRNIFLGLAIFSLASFLLMLTLIGTPGAILCGIGFICAATFGIAGLTVEFFRSRIIKKIIQYRLFIQHRL